MTFLCFYFGVAFLFWIGGGLLEIWRGNSISVADVFMWGILSVFWPFGLLFWVFEQPFWSKMEAGFQTILQKFFDYEIIKRDPTKH